jgi:uncharacterized RDD family membrane protein YckC
MIDPNYNRRIDAGTRVGAMLLDHIFMTIMAMVFFIPGMVVTFTNAFKIDHTPESTDMFGGMIYLSIVGFALYLCKDCINGRSLAKRLLKLQVVDNVTGEAASPLKCFVRNIFIIIWPIEVIVGLTNTSRRLGDRAAGTKLVVFDSFKNEPPINLVKLLLPLVLSYTLMLFLFIPFLILQKKIGGPEINYIESSYNNKYSKETEQLFADSLGNYLTASVKVYDKIQDKPLKYASVIFLLKENYLEDDQQFQEIRSKTLRLLSQKLPVSKFIGQVKYVYRTEGSMTTRTEPLK